MSMELYFTAAPAPELRIESDFSSVLQSQEVVTIITEVSIGLRGKDGSNTINDPEAVISSDPDNRLKLGSDAKLHVSDTLSPDPLVFYLLAKG